MDRGLANLSKTQARDMIKENFKFWEEGAGWNKLFAPDTDEYSKDGSIQKFRNGTLLAAGSTETPKKTLWQSFHQVWSKDKNDYLNEHQMSSMKTLIREQVRGGGAVRMTVPPPFSIKSEKSTTFGTASSG